MTESLQTLLKTSEVADNFELAEQSDSIGRFQSLLHALATEKEIKDIESLAPVDEETLEQTTLDEFREGEVLEALGFANNLILQYEGRDALPLFTGVARLSQYLFENDRASLFTVYNNFVIQDAEVSTHHIKIMPLVLEHVVQGFADHYAAEFAKVKPGARVIGNQRYEKLMNRFYNDLKRLEKYSRDQLEQLIKTGKVKPDEITYEHVFGGGSEKKRLNSAYFEKVAEDGGSVEQVTADHGLPTDVRVGGNKKTRDLRVTLHYGGRQITVRYQSGLTSKEALFYYNLAQSVQVGGVPSSTLRSARKTLAGFAGVDEFKP